MLLSTLRLATIVVVFVCGLIGSEPGVKRHLKATHHVPWQEFPEVTDAQMKLPTPEPASEPSQSLSLKLKKKYSEEEWVDIGKGWGLVA